MLQLLVMTSTRKVLSISFVLLFISTFGLQVFPSAKVGATPGVTITSPTPNQSFSGTNFTVTGTATPNTTVVVSNNGLSFAQTISNASGVWSINSSLPAGQVKITAKAIENPTYGYFPTTALDFSGSNINQLDLNNLTINPNVGWPVTSPRLVLGLMPAPIGSLFYTTNAFSPAALPEKFDSNSPAEPVPASGTFPTDPQTNKGDFNSTATKYYTGSISENHVVSVVDVAANAHLTDINVGSTPTTVWRAPNGKIFAVLKSNQIKIIDPTTDTVETTVDISCTDAEATSVVNFSQDSNYPYYYVPCMQDGTLHKMRLSDNSEVDTFNIGGSPVTAALSLDNKRMFVSNLTGSADKAKMRVVNTDDGSIITTIDLTAGVLGFLATPDFQKVIIATPENLTTSSFDVENIDIIDTSDYSKTSVATTGFPTTVTFLPSQIAEASVDVSFVLGATTATPSGKLAETGVITIPATLLLGIIFGSLTYMYLDYRKHKRPLRAIDPNVKYTFIHHIKVVSVPTLQYRVKYAAEKRSRVRA